MSKNKLIIAAAGSGKTTSLIEKALEQKDGKVLVTTYTQANEAEIRCKIIKANKCIPGNITVQTWFSFLMQHGVRPYQGCLFEKHINGLILVNSASGVKYFAKKNGAPIFFSEEAEFERHYFSRDTKIYSDKLSKFVFRCNEKTNGAVIDRLSRVYPYVFIDEIQDLAGYDLELLKLLFNSDSNTLLVGDPRQGTYSTNSSLKNKKYRKSEITDFFLDPSIKIEIDTDSLTINYRCIQEICELSNKLFPDFQETNSGNLEKTEHNGIYLVKKKDVESYLKRYNPMQLRNDSKVTINENYQVMTFGESKGLSFDRILIYPTKNIINWLLDNQTDLPQTSRSKFYVAITRAKYSVGIVYDYDSNLNVSGLALFK